MKTLCVKHWQEVVCRVGSLFNTSSQCVGYASNPTLRANCCNAVNGLHYSETRGLLIATSEGLDIYDGQNFTHVLKDDQVLSVSSFSDDKICIKCYDSSNDILLLEGLDIFITQKLPLETSAQRVFTDVDSSGVWIALQEIGLLYYDISSQTYQHYFYDKYNKHGIKSNAITKLYRDGFHNLWICTFDAGISFIPHTQKRFFNIKDNFSISGLQNNRVRSIYQDSDNDIWVGTKVDGALSLYDREMSTFSHYRHSDDDEESLSNDYIFCITEDRPGYLWVATYNGLNLFDKKTGKCQRFFHDPENSNSISSNIIYTLLKIDDLLYIGGDNGLDVLNTQTGEFVHYGDAADSTGLTNLFVRTMCCDTSGNIWIGTVKGLNCFDTKKKEFMHFRHDLTDHQSISNNILSV